MTRIFAILTLVSLIAVGTFAETSTTTTTSVTKMMTATTVAKGTVKMVSGKIVSFTATTGKTEKGIGSLVVTDKNDMQITVTVYQTTKIVNAKKEILTVRDLAAGTHVTVDYYADKMGAKKIIL